MKLSPELIDQLRPGHDQWFPDDDCPGLKLRVRSSGKKAYYLDCYVGTRRRQVRLAAVGAVTLEQARQIAREHRKTIALGADPFQPTQREERNAPGALTRPDAKPERSPRLRALSGSSDRKGIERHVKPVPIINLHRLIEADIERLVGEASESTLMETQSSYLAAFRMPDESMARVVPEGALVIFDYERAEIADGYLTIARADCSVMLRRLRLTNGPLRLEPEPREHWFPVIFPKSLQILGRPIELRVPLER